MSDCVYLEFLVEDKSGAVLLERILEKYKEIHPDLIFRIATSYYEIGKQKCIWADKIGINMDLRKNKSPSFNYLLSKLDSLIL